MKVSTRGRYALRLVLDLAMHRHDGFVSLKQISERQNISKKYLEQIVPLLRRNDILRTVRGNRGGYQLAKSPDKLTVGEILQATVGTLAPVACLEDEVNRCPRARECQTLYVWNGLYQVIHDYLYHITIEDILQHSQDMHGNDYCI